MLERKEIKEIIDYLEMKKVEAKLNAEYLFVSMYQDWIDKIKNCDVTLKEAKQMLRAAKLN